MNNKGIVKVNDIINGFPEPQGVHKWARNLRVTDIDFPIGPEGKGVRAVNERGTVYAFKYDEFEIVARAKVPATTTERVNATWSGFKVGDTVVEIVNGGADVIVKREGEATTAPERMPVAHMSELQVGDVVETAYNRSTLHAYVMRVPKPAEPEFGFGTAYVFGGSLLNHGEQQKRYRGFRSESGNFYYLTDDGKQRSAWAGQFEGFRIED